MSRCISLFLIIIIFNSCTNDVNSAKVYKTHEALKAHDVKTATVLHVENVILQKDGLVVGQATGAILGAITGRGFESNSSVGKKVVTTLAVVIGGALGNLFEKKVTNRKALKITLQLDNGKVYAIIQEADIQFNVKDRVYITTSPDGRQRVNKA